MDRISRVAGELARRFPSKADGEQAHRLHEERDTILISVYVLTMVK